MNLVSLYKKYKKSIGQTNFFLFIQLIIFYLLAYRGLILLFVEEEVVFGGVVGPDFFDAFVGFAFVFHLLEVLDHFEGCAATHCVVDEFVLCCGPGCVFEF